MAEDWGRKRVSLAGLLVRVPARIDGSQDTFSLLHSRCLVVSLPRHRRRSNVPLQQLLSFDSLS